MYRNTLIAAAVCGLLVLYGCGGGGGPTTDASDLEHARSDPRVIRAGTIFEGANSLITVAIYEEYEGSVPGGQRERFTVAAYGTCATGTRCVLYDGDLAYPLDKAVLSVRLDTDSIEFSRIDLGHRAGFDTSYAEATISAATSTYVAELAGRAYGVWGEYGYAEASFGIGPFTDTSQGVGFSGDVKTATAFVLGSPTWSNPAGVGSATWRDPAEAISVSSYQRRSGTATITMADLLVPEIDVDVAIGGRQIGSAAWDNITLDRGWFGVGLYGQDALAGNFFGPQHQEVYGVFDTGAYVGAFGAKRDE